MKSLYSFIFLFLFANSAFAANLCDTSCNLTITFPTGGSITVVEPLVLTFGDGGLVETGSATAPYANGSILAMDAGEVLTFGANGSFNLGSGGNMDYTNIAVETTGDVTVEAVGGAEVISILNISATAGTILFNSDTTVENNFSLTGDMLVGGTGTITNLGMVDIVSNTVTFTNSFINAGTLNIISGTAVFEADFNCENGSSIVGLSSGGVIISGTLDIVSGISSLDAFLQLTSSSIVLGSGTLEVSGLTGIQLGDSSNFIAGTLNAIEINDVITTTNFGETIPEITLSPEMAIDGVLYQVEYITVDGEAVTIATAPDGTTGTIEFIDGELVYVPDEEQPEQSGSGTSGWLLVVGLPLLMSVLRRRKVTGSFSL